MNKRTLGYFAVLLLLLVGSGGFFTWKVLSSPDSSSDELLLGIFIITAIVALFTLLYILAVGFNMMNLTDAKQPLGLPEGSIRAMIALILIIAFIIFGIYLFRSVGGGVSNELETRISADSLKKINLDKYRGSNIHIESNNDSTFSIVSVQKVSDEGYKLAQQLLTTVGTLVVAISSFYFGSTTVSSAMSSSSRGSSPAGAEQPVKPLQSPPEPVKTEEQIESATSKKRDDLIGDQQVAEISD